MSAETPWALVLKLRSEGADEATVRNQLTLIHALSSADIDLLLESPPTAPPASRVRMPALLLGVATLGVAIVLFFFSRFATMGLFAMGLGRIATALSGKVPGDILPAVTYATPLAPDDRSPRCALHPDFASVYTCPKCGAFACAASAPKRAQKKGRCLACAARA